MNRLGGKTVLVTGADGFIGSHLAERLVDETAKVRALCLYNSQGSFGWLDEIDAGRLNGIDIQLGDVRDARCVREATKGIDIVFHLAALIAIPYSYAAPNSYVETNVCGTLNVLEAVRDDDRATMVHTSTSEVYGTPRTVPITEGHPLQAQSPYSASKIAADKLCESFARSFNTPVVTLRPFNTFGPRQSARAVIPTILGQLLGGSSIVRLGNLDPIRDFTFVDDTVEGFVRMASAALPPGEVVHLGTGRGVSMGDLLVCCEEATGTEAVHESDPGRVRPKGSEVECLISDFSHARDTIGWSPTIDLETGLRRTVAWMANRNLGDTARYQI